MAKFWPFRQENRLRLFWAGELLHFTQNCVILQTY